MKYLVKFFVVTFFLLICTHAFAEQKIVVLDMKYVLNNSKAGKGAQDFLKKSFNKLNNPQFIAKAPKKIIEQFKIQSEDIKSSIEKIEQIINTIK